jgi:hypothetical protein
MRAVLLNAAGQPLQLVELPISPIALTTKPSNKKNAKVWTRLGMCVKPPASGACFVGQLVIGMVLTMSRAFHFIAQALTYTDVVVSIVLASRQL